MQEICEFILFDVFICWIINTWESGKNYWKWGSNFYLCLFVCRHPTDQLWRCRLEIFYWTSKSNFFCFVFWVKKTFPGVTHYLNIKFYFSNACLNSAETHILFPSTKIRSKDAWFQVSILFVFFLNPLSKQFGMYLKVFKFRGY